MLELADVHAAYGPARVLAGVTIAVRPGEVVTLLGANGAGKTTLIRCVCGLLRPARGQIRWRGARLDGTRPDVIVERGIAVVPEGRRLFGGLSVEENLDLGAFVPRARGGRLTRLEAIYATFPVLRERRRQLAGALSGGQQQMLAIGRALMTNPELLILDEPSLGLAPRMVDRIFEVIGEVNRAGVSVLLVEQNVRAALEVAARGYVLESGRVAAEGRAAALLDDPHVRHAYLGPLASSP